MGAAIMILGIDPGKTGGFCLIEKGKVQDCGIINTHNFQELRDLAIEFKSRYGLNCYCEGIHFQGKKFNPRSFSEHAISIGLVWGVMESHGIKVHIIGATTWQSKELVISGQRCPAGDTKVWSVKVAESYGADLSQYTKALKPNVADAVCIAAHGEKQGRLK
jgi:hypothetical protein